MYGGMHEQINKEKPLKNLYLINSVYHILFVKRTTKVFPSQSNVSGDHFLVRVKWGESDHDPWQSEKLEMITVSILCPNATKLIVQKQIVVPTCKKVQMTGRPKDENN